MRVYIMVVEDRHDAEVEVFSDKDLAIKAAKSKAVEYAQSIEDIKVQDHTNLLYFAFFSEDKDCVWVIEKTLIEE